MEHYLKRISFLYTKLHCY